MFDQKSPLILCIETGTVGSRVSSSRLVLFSFVMKDGGSLLNHCEIWVKVFCLRVLQVPSWRTVDFVLTIECLEKDEECPNRDLVWLTLTCTPAHCLPGLFQVCLDQCCQFSETHRIKDFFY